VFSALAVVPLLMGPPFSFARLLATGTLAALAVFMLGSGRARQLAIVVDLQAGTLTHGTRVTSLPRTSMLRLGSSQRGPERAPQVPYRVELSLGDGRRECLLERNEPAGVLRDLSRLLGVWPTPVQRGWGLPQDAQPWVHDDRAASLEAAPAIDVRGRPSASAQGGALAAGVGGTLVAFIIGMILLARLRRGANVDALSLILPGLSLTLLMVLAAYLITARLRVVSDAHALSVERRAFGAPWARFRVNKSALLGVFAVSSHPEPESPAHLLIQTRQGPFAFRCTRELAATIASAVQPRQNTLT
jgi:hypothetical protein